MKIAIITGPSLGLGVEFTKTIIEQYPQLDEIWIIARRKERLEHFAEDNPDKKICAIVLDLSSDGKYDKLETLLSDLKPQISILINNAGYGHSGFLVICLAASSIDDNAADGNSGKSLYEM